MKRIIGTKDALPLERDEEKRKESRRAMGRWLRLVTPYIHRVTALFAVGAGVYLIYYGIF